MAAPPGGAGVAAGAPPAGPAPNSAKTTPPNTVVHVRAPRAKTEDDGVRGVKGSTRLEAKRQRRRDGRETRPPARRRF